MEERNSALELRRLIGKLGHELSEIRRRSLQSLLSKLRNDLVQYEDLIHQRELFTHLLQNIHNDPDDVVYILDLLTILSKFPFASKTLIQLGGVEYFTQFRKDLHGNESHVGSVDDILNNLFLLHSHLEDEEVDRVPTEIATVVAVPDFDYDKYQKIIDSYDSAKSTTFNESDNESAMTSHHKQVVIEMPNQRLGDMQVSPNDLTFPWISLTSGDRQILAVTDNRLQSSSFDLIIQSCTFLKGVLLHDFPAEVFIQRPNIVKTLFSVLALYKGKRLDVVEHILTCLYVLCTKLQKRLLQQQNQDLWLPQQTPEDIQSLSISTNPTESSSLSSKSTSRLQTTEGTSVTDIDGKKDDDDDLESSLITNALVQAQLYLTDFLLQILHATVDLLQLYVDENFLFSNVVMLHISIMRLLQLGHLQHKWDSSLKEDKKMIYNLMSLLHKFDDVVSQFMNDTPVSSDGPQMTLKAVIVCQVVMKLLDATVPDHRVYEVLTDKLVQFFQFVVTKVSFISMLENMKASLEKYLSLADETFYRSYVKALDVVKSVKNLDAFFQGIISESEQLKTCQDIIVYLDFHCNQQFIDDVINLCCEKYLRDVTTKNKWKKLLLKILRHRSDGVKECVYKSCSDKLKLCFSSSLVSEPLSTKHQSALLLLHKKILQPIIHEGIFHKNIKISNISKNIIVTILTSRLNMSTKYWKIVTNNLPSFLPHLQGCLGNKDNAFDQSLFSFIKFPQTIMSVDGSINGLTEVERTKACFRLLFSKKVKIRSTGFVLSLTFITERDKEKNKVFRYNQSNNKSTFEDLFVFNSKYLVGVTNEPTLFGDIAVESIQKLWELLSDRLVDCNLRYSAAEQLSILFQDRRLQKAVGTQESYKYILEELSEHIFGVDGIWNESNVDEKYILSLLRMLKHFIQHQASIRHILALQQDVFLELFQVGLLFCNNNDMCYEISVILVYLLFDDVIVSNNMLKEEFFVPTSILDSYKFPIKFQALDACKSSNEDTHDLQEMLQSKQMLSFIKESCLLQCDWMKSDDRKHMCRPQFKITIEDRDKIERNNFSNIIETVNHNLMHAGDHFSAMSNIGQFQLLLLIIADRKSENTIGILKAFTDNCQNGFIKRILETPPSTEDDYKLFQRTISFVECALRMNIDKDLSFLQDILISDLTVKLIKDSSQRVDETKWTKWARTTKQSIVSCLASLYEHMNLSQVTWESTQSCQSAQLGNIIVAIYQDLSLDGSESYYDLPLMEVMLGCLVHLLTRRKWSMDLISGENICVEMFNWLTQVLMSFHVDRVSAAVSFMGKGIVQKSVTCLCHLLHEIKMFNGINLLQTSLHHTEHSNSSQVTSLLQASQLPWLVPLLSDRSIPIRWGGWALSTTLVSDAVTSRQLVVNEFQSLPGGLWAASLGVVLDEKECFLVRTQACMVLLNLIENYDEEQQDSLWGGMIVQDTNSKTEISGLDAFLLLLDHFEFFSELRNFFNNDFKNVNISSALLINASTSFSQTSAHENTTSGITSVGKSVRSNDSKGSGISAVGNRSDEVSLTSKRDFSIGSSSTTHGLSTNNNSVRSTTLQRGSLRFKFAVLKLITHLIPLCPVVVMRKLKEQQIISKILSTWSTKSLIESTKHLLAHPNEKTLYQSFHDHINVTISMLKLLRVIVHNDESILNDVKESSVMKSVYMLFTLCKYTYPALQKEFMLVWDEVMTVIADMKFHEEAINNLQYICGSFISVVNTCKYESRTINQFLHLILCTLKNADNIDDYVIEDDLQPISISDALLMYPKLGTKMADVLSDMLLCAYDKSYMFKNQSLVRKTLSCLFARSKRSQAKALEKGFVESVIEEMKDGMIKLNMLSLDDEKNVRKKRHDILSGIGELLDLIRNFCVYNETVKRGFVTSGFLQHLQSVWLCCGLNEPLKHSLLQMLIVLSANCGTAQTSLCVLTSERQTLEEACFLQYVIKMLMQLHHQAVQVHGKLDNCLRWCFEILTNTLNVTECRSILYKANMFHLFINAYNLTSSGNKTQRGICKNLITDWLRLFLALSYFQDGAIVVGKLPGCLNIFFDTLKVGSKQRKDMTLLIIRNLLFVARLKQNIISNQTTIDAVMESLTSPSIKTKLISVSIFQVMLYENQKAKVLIKQTKLSNKLLKLKEDVETGRCLAVDGNLELHDQIKRCLTITLNLLNS